MPNYSHNRVNQRNIIKEALSKSLVLGSNWYEYFRFSSVQIVNYLLLVLNNKYSCIVSSTWFRKWQIYVNFDGSYPDTQSEVFSVTFLFILRSSYRLHLNIGRKTTKIFIQEKLKMLLC